MVVLNKGGKGKWTKGVIAPFLEWGTKYVDPFRFMRAGLYENERLVKSSVKANVALELRKIAAETQRKTLVER